MIGVANKQKGYGPEDERLLSTFANQIAVAIDNAGLYLHQQQMIARLQQLHAHLAQAERDQIVAAERERMAAAFVWTPVPGRPGPGPRSAIASWRFCASWPMDCRTGR